MIFELHFKTEFSRGDTKVGSRHSYSTRPGGILSGSRLHNYQTMGKPVHRLGSVQTANEIVAALAQLEAFTKELQDKKFARKLLQAVPVMRARKDKRCRPKGVSKKVFKAYRKFKLK